MTHRNDCKKLVLETALSTTGHINDLELAYWQSLGATANNLNDARLEYYLANGATSNNVNDAENEYYIALGALSLNKSVNESWFWCVNGGAVTGISAPTDIAGCCIWLDGSDMADGGTADANSTWVDKSIAGNDFAHSGSADNSLDPDGSVYFNGTGGHFQYQGNSGKLVDSGGSALTEGEIFVTVKVSDVTRIQQFLYFSQRNDYYMNGTATSAVISALAHYGSSQFAITITDDPTEYCVVNISSDGSWKYRHNGILLSSKTTAFYAATYGRFGDNNSTSNEFKGNIKSLVMYDHVLSDDDRDAAYAYMSGLV